MRIEKDIIGEVHLNDDYPFGINTYRASQNFRFSDQKIREDIFLSLISVKQSAARANFRAGLLEKTKADLIERACIKIKENISEFIPDLHPFQGGAGTSTNMAANELIANTALKLNNMEYGRYSEISPLDHVNLSQSTNDTYPTAVKIAILKALTKLHDSCEILLNVLWKKEKEFSHILKIGRTEFQDAMPLSLGQTFSAWGEAVSRFRWRLAKASDWIREVNISGTAVGTSINADPVYRAEVIKDLRKSVQEPLCLGRNLVDNTQNLDTVVEISGLIKTGAVSIKKIASDIRILSSGPSCGIGELILEPVQAGSTIMPGKVNPVMYEAAEQICLSVIGSDGVISTAASESNLELPQFLPFIAHTLLSNMELLINLLPKFADNISKIKADTEKIKEYIDSSFSVAALLTPVLGYEKLSEAVKGAKKEKKRIIDYIRENKMADEETLNRVITPAVMAGPGIPVLKENK